ncbi:MAG: hypothetical protein IKR63_02905 [Alloprevotella sp.]|nr:hypothetical protein [Alloprevotella sp.]MBR6339065.1 hypothetical protein [Alloprevotella sp.]
MKKSLILMGLLTLSFAACTDSKPQAEAENTNEPTIENVAQTDPEAEEAVKAYEDYLVKYEALANKKQAGADIFNELMNLQTDESFAVSEKLLKTESKRNAQQQARVKEVERKVDSIKQIFLND